MNKRLFPTLRLPQPRRLPAALNMAGLGTSLLWGAVRKLFTGKTYTTADHEFARWASGTGTEAGENVSPQNAMQQATVFTCGRILSETIGTLPGGMFTRDDAGNAERDDEHPLSEILFHSPNADMDAVAFHEALILNLAIQGNAYNLIEKRGQRVSSLFPIPADLVEPVRDNKTGNTLYWVYDRGKREPYPREKIWHVKGFGGNGLTGLSPVGYMRETIGMALATEKWQARFFANGAQPSWLVKVPIFFDPVEKAKARANLDEIWGPRRAYKAQLLEGGMEATPATMPLADAQFLELRGATREEIFGFFRIPPHMGADLERSTNNNIEQQALEFVMYAIMPYLVRIEKSVARWLMPPGEWRKVFLRYNVEGLLRADSKARSELWAVMADRAIMSRNEIRLKENMNRSTAPGMDDFTVQTALVPIDMLRKLAERQAEPKPQPVAPAQPVPVSGGGGKSNQIFVIQGGATEMKLAVQPPEVTVQPAQVTVGAPQVTVAAPNVAVGAPEVKVGAPQVHVHNDGVAQMLAGLGELMGHLVDVSGRPYELVTDKEGTVIGSRRVEKLPVEED